MKRKDPAVIFAHKQSLLVERTAAALGVEIDKAVELLKIGRQQSIRLNPLRYSDKSAVLKQLETLGWKGEQYSWIEDGYTLEQGLEAIRDSQLVESGQVYIQNAASWLPVLALDVQPGEKVLDLCAAPGGKTAHIAAVARNLAEIWVNDNSRPRLAKMRANFNRLGVEITESTLYDVTKIASRLEGQLFDKILLDAPCSGEGMMQLDKTKDFESWSVAHIRRLQQLQKKAIVQAVRLLKPGGTLVYSTCTMAPEENEMVIDYLLRKAGDIDIQKIDISCSNAYPTVTTWNAKALHVDINNCLRLGPSNQIEAFFVAKIKSRSLALESSKANLFRRP